MYLTNSRTGAKEEFKPQSDKAIGMYVCGPTVYARPHIGNLRSAVVFDLLYRVLKSKYDNVTYVRNITDVDDKILQRAQAEGLQLSDITEKSLDQYNADLSTLNCLPPTATPRARSHIAEMIRMIEDLINSGYAYVSAGHVIFDITKYPSYGQLSNRDPAQMQDGARVDVADYKRNAGDFILWKPQGTLDTDESVFPSPWGDGRPGWHIECSAMAEKYLGKTFDIHGGGIDLLFPHHENERAQSCCANNTERMANYWVHNGFITFSGEKMSKSLGNIASLGELSSKELLALRYFYLTVHYRKPLDFTTKSMEDAHKAMTKLSSYDTHGQERDEELVSALYDDLNTPMALAILHKRYSAKQFKQLSFGLDMLGLKKIEEKEEEANIPQKIISLAEQRWEAKQAKDWSKADELRLTLEEEGWRVIDKKDAYELKKI